MKIDRGKLKKSSSEVGSLIIDHCQSWIKYGSKEHLQSSNHLNLSFLLTNFSHPEFPVRETDFWDQFQVPADCRSLIEELKGSTQTEFLHKLRGIETWTYGMRSALYLFLCFRWVVLWTQFSNVTWACIGHIFPLQNGLRLSMTPLWVHSPLQDAQRFSWT